MKAWTDCPILALGDSAELDAPIREVEVVAYDGDKYCRVRVDGVEAEVKAGYIYQQEGRYGKVLQVERKQLETLDPRLPTVLELASLVREVRKDVCDRMWASQREPSARLTVGWNPKNGDWSYYLGCSGFGGGSYTYPVETTVWINELSDCEKVAESLRTRLIILEIVK